MGEALQCITWGRLTARPKQRLKVDTPYSVTLNEMDPVSLTGEDSLHLSVGQTIRIVKLDDPDDPRGPLKVQTIRYFYLIAMPDNRDILSFHWMREAEIGDEANAVVFPHSTLGRP